MKKDLEQLVYYASLAPSGHNTQPWKFHLEEDKISIYPDFQRRLPVVDGDDHALYISLGCALENLVIAANHFGYHSDVYIHKGASSFIEVQLEKLAQFSEFDLFHQIKIRQSTRNLYDGKEVPASHLDLLKSSTIQEDVGCILLTDMKDIEPVIELVKEACVLQLSNSDFVDELVHWIRFNKSAAGKTNDGIYGASTGNPNIPDWFGKIIMGVTLNPEKEANKCEEQIKSSSGLAIFIAERNDKKAWINTGRSFERFALTATALNINNAHENMPCEEVSIREKLKEILNLHQDQQPLLLVRFGYSEKMPYSYRRPVKELIYQPLKELDGEIF
jgi:hypothetical protein